MTLHHFSLWYEDKLFYQPNIIKNMNSFMFTFSANQPILQLSQDQKQQGCLLQTFRRRPTSSSVSKQDKSRNYSSNVDQLFEKPHHHDVNTQESPQKAISSLRIKNSSMQLQQKKKIRNMIDTMLGKNFQMQSNPKLDSIVFTNRKNLNKHRSYLTGTKKSEQGPKDFYQNEYKQNQQNENNSRNEMNMESGEMMEKQNKTKIKLKKFQFAAIKINKKTQYSHSHRYDVIEKQEEVKENYNQQFFKRKGVNVSRESIDKEGVDKKFIKTKTPKIMYPQSDSKLPSIFRTTKHKNIVGESLKKQKRVSSAHYLPEDKIIEEEESIIVRRKSTLENEQTENQVGRRLRFRPKSIKMQQKMYPKSQYDSGDNQNLSNQFNPKRLVFDTNQQFCANIKRRLVSQRPESPNATVVRIATRAKSTHCKFVFHKLRNSNQTQQMNVFEENEGNELIKNDSTQSKETAQESTFQSFTDASLQNVNEDLVDSMELRQFGLGCSVTFQIHKS